MRTPRFVRFVLFVQWDARRVSPLAHPILHARWLASGRYLLPLPLTEFAVISSELKSQGALGNTASLNNNRLTQTIVSSNQVGLAERSNTEEWLGAIEAACFVRGAAAILPNLSSIRLRDYHRGEMLNGQTQSRGEAKEP